MYMIKIVALGLFLININAVFASSSYKKISIHTKTAENVIDIDFPQGSSSNINNEIEKLINRLKKNFVSSALQEEFPKEEWDKEWEQSFIRVHSRIQYETSRVVSIVFDVLVYGEGAAHPNASTEMLTFIDGNKVEISKLFKLNSDYLSMISQFCFDSLFKQLSTQWPEQGVTEEETKSFKEGTRPIVNNFQKWYLNKKGLVIVFEQLSYFANGSVFHVTIPYEILKNWECTKKNSGVFDET